MHSIETMMNTLGRVGVVGSEVSEGTKDVSGGRQDHFKEHRMRNSGKDARVLSAHVIYTLWNVV